MTDGVLTVNAGSSSIKYALFAAGSDAADGIVEECNLGLDVLVALDLRAQPVAVEFVEQPGQRGRFHVELVECLHRGEAGGSAGP